MLDHPPVLSAEGLSKNYLLWDSPSARLISVVLDSAGKRALLPIARRWLLKKSRSKAQTVAALKPISFELRPGESLGIIGRNGSGKSTLLQILAGTLTPTTGTVIRNGRITALLELGSGFNPEFTGRENVYMQAALYGFDEETTKALIPKVEAFAEIGQFIDQPVKTYSSGMMVRLAFAAQTIVDPEVFIVDEALAVGDVFFQAKCTRWFRDKLAQGMSLILVTHDLASVKALCSRTILLEEGRVMFEGDSDLAVSKFHEIHQSGSEVSNGDKAESAIAKQSDKSFRNWTSEDEIGAKEAEIIRFNLLDTNNRMTQSFLVGEPIRMRIDVKANQSVPEAHVAFQIVDRHSKAIYGINSRTIEDLTKGLNEGETGHFEVEIAGLLGSGDFIVDAAIVAGDRGDGAPAHHYHRIGGIIQFSVRHPGLKPSFLGAANLQASVAWKPSEQ